MSSALCESQTLTVLFINVSCTILAPQTVKATSMPEVKMDMVALLLLRTIMSTFILLLDFCVKPKAHRAQLGVTRCTVHINQSATPSVFVTWPVFFFFIKCHSFNLTSVNVTVEIFTGFFFFFFSFLSVLLTFAQVAHFGYCFCFAARLPLDIMLDKFCDISLGKRESQGLIFFFFNIYKYGTE